MDTPLLLKPNGAPVFQNINTDALNLNVERDEPDHKPQQQTVIAHSFLAGKKITNQTEISKTSCPEE